MIRLSGLNKYFNKGTQAQIHVLNNVTLELPNTGMTAIFGKSGCGKTTLLNVIGGLDKFGSGRVEIDGESITQNTDLLRNREIGYIFQNYCLNKEQTVFENIANALYLCGIKDKETVSSRVKAALRNVDMDGFENRLPDTLSGGQQQRIAIARAIVKTPKIILADEPTGNLDEANTIKIMDLLRALAEDCLVVLVTHEANLVDFYCDTVVEISDGCITGIRENARTGGYVAKDKNTVYLGEYEKSESDSALAKITYYGEKPKEPLGITVVNRNGSLYLKVANAKVRFLDESAEIRLAEGVFETTQRKKQNAGVDMSDLPPLHGTRFGKLFSFRSSLISGYKTVFRKGKKSKRGLRVVMGLFAAVLVFMTAFFGTSVKSIFDINGNYDHNLFLLNTDSEKDSEILLNASAEESGIDYLTLRQVGYYGGSNKTLSLNAGFFETFSTSSWYGDSGFSVDSTEWLGTELAKDLPLVAGTKDNLADNEILLSVNVADKFLKSSTWGHIKTYEDLLHLLTSSAGSVDGKQFSVAGIVKTDEPTVYFSEIALAELYFFDYDPGVCRASAYGAAVEKGSVQIVLSDNGYLDYSYSYEDGVAEKESTEKKSSESSYEIGDTVTLYGKDFKISAVTESADVWYEQYLLSDEDLIALSKQYGKSNTDTAYSWGITYTAIHSSNPEKTEAFLLDRFDRDDVTTPTDQYDGLMVLNRAAIIGSLAAMAIILALMSICMYFVMRSAMMTRIREYGILRAIGVSSGNLLFRSFTESLLLTSLTVTVGFLISSTIVRFWLNYSVLFESYLFYPLWIAGVLLALIYVICIFCGILPMLFLLRKTPSQILSKYDI